MRRLVIIGNAISYNNSAATARMLNYAKSITSVNDTEVFFLSLNEDDEYSVFKPIATPSRIYKRKKRQHICKPNLRGLWIRFDSLKELVPGYKDASYLFYPGVNCISEFLFLIWCRVNNIRNSFSEINEVRRYWTKLPSLPVYKRLLYKFVFNISERFSKYYSGLICINKNISEYYSRYNHNAIIVPILSDINSNKSFNSLNFGSKISFTFTGSVDIEKENLEELFKGFALFDKANDLDWEFNLYGYADANMIKRINCLLNELHLSNKIHLKGSINRELIPNILATSDCLILPRKNDKQNYYGFSTKLSEYLVSGTPVILTDTGVICDYLTDGKDCLIVKGYSGKDFSQTLKRFVDLSFESKMYLAKNALSTATKYFSPSIYSDTFCEFLFATK